MAQARDWKQRLPDWLEREALPLWTGAGIDTATGTTWEALDHEGKPCADMTRRLRVQVRQAYCFAQSEDPAHRTIALQLFRFAMDHGFDPATGHLAATLGPDLKILTAPHDLYDLAFMALAAASLIEAGHDVTADLHRLQTELAQLKAPRGWHETAAHKLPRRQNPHMHLFEASIALFRATGATRFRDMADECLGLFQDVFLQDDGRIFEFYADDWTPLTGAAQSVEPGHMAEWVFLLDAYETTMGQSAGVDLQTLFNAMLALRDPGGLLPDHTEPEPAQTRRMWPQTELLKAGLVAHRRGWDVPETAMPDALMELLWDQYFETPVAGGWYDKRHADGRLLSTNMPASSFYHILIAFRFYLSGGTH